MQLERLMSLPVSEVMTRGCVEILADQTMDSAAEEFLNHRITGVPVVDDEGRCVGILSSTDFIWHERSGTPDDPVRLYMSSKVIAVGPEQPLVDAARLMCEHRIHRVPVVNQNFCTLGIVTSLDIVAALVDMTRPAAADLALEPTGPAEPGYAIR